MRLLEVEARLLGVLIEKQMTTPDGYPLSANALRSGANQKSNRDPVVDWSEAEILVGVAGLVAKDLADPIPHGRGSRVERWAHRAADKLGIGSADLAVLAELLLRGPQAPGELRQRASRMHDIASLTDLQPVLERLIARRLVRRLAPGIGSRSERYRETLTEHVEALAHSAPQTAEEVLARHDREPQLVRKPDATPATVEQRIEALERRVAMLEQRSSTDEE